MRRCLQAPVGFDFPEESFDCCSKEPSLRSTGLFCCFLEFGLLSRVWNLCSVRALSAGSCAVCLSKRINTYAFSETAG